MYKKPLLQAVDSSCLLLAGFTALTLDYCLFVPCSCRFQPLLHFANPLSPNIHIQILQTDLHTFPLRISWENLIKHHGIFSFVIILYIFTTLSLDNVWILLGKNCSWTLLGLKGLIAWLPSEKPHEYANLPFCNLSLVYTSNLIQTNFIHSKWAVSWNLSTFKLTE